MSSESRIWEIRPFGSMRGGKELVIGPCAFQSILSRLLYKREWVEQIIVIFSQLFELSAFLKDFNSAFEKR